MINMAGWKIHIFNRGIHLQKVHFPASYVSFLEGLFFSSNMLKHFEIGNCFFCT